MPQCITFYDYLGLCNESFKVNALLEPATSYKWVIQDKFNKEYSGVVTSDGDGFLTILASALPDGFFTSYSGDFQLTLFKNDEHCRQINFKMAAYYDEICFHIKAGTNEKTNLGCSFACVAPGGGAGNSAVFPFDDIATLNIPWTALLSSFYGNGPLVQVYIETSPGTYELTNVSIEQNLTGYMLSSIDIDFGGNATGYVLIS